MAGDQGHPLILRGLDIASVLQPDLDRLTRLWQEKYLLNLVIIAFFIRVDQNLVTHL